MRLWKPPVYVLNYPLVHVLSPLSSLLLFHPYHLLQFAL